jgi:hypothetical protein
MNDGIALTYIAQELVAQTLTLAGTLYQSGYIHNLNGGGNYSARVNQFCQFVEALIGNGDGSYVGLYCAERKIGCLCLSA